MSSVQSSVVLLDIEGTTTPISFVYDVLFPYARTRLRTFLEDHADEADVRGDLDLLLAENRHDASVSSGVPVIPENMSPPSLRMEGAYAYLVWLMDQDRKSPALKSLQGKIWEAGYAGGEIRSIIFPDIPTAFERWHQQGRRIVIYSSGSVLAQRLIFGHTQAGDLTRWIEAYFDTGVGAKTQSASYMNIAGELGVLPRDLLFVSDAPAELDAATEAGLQVRLAVRPGNRAVPSTASYAAVMSFDEL
jgi:enolase-phosphatase E1